MNDYMQNIEYIRYIFLNDNVFSLTFFFILLFSHDLLGYNDLTYVILRDESDDNMSFGSLIVQRSVKYTWAYFMTQKYES